MHKCKEGQGFGPRRTKLYVEFKSAVLTQKMGVFQRHLWGRLASTGMKRPGLHAEVPLASLNKREILIANNELALAA